MSSLARLARAARRAEKQCSDGPMGRRSASLTVAPVGNGTEEVTGAIAIAVDVSALVQAQSKAKEASSRYETPTRLPLVTYLYAAGDRSSPIYVSPHRLWSGIRLTSGSQSVISRRA